jgi:alkaline phosphatase D
MDRRTFLKSLSLSALAPWYVASCAEDEGLEKYVWDGPLGPEDVFSHSVASGDPLSDAAIIWTRVSLESHTPVEVFFEVARDEAFKDRVSAGYVGASAYEDHTVKIDVTGLAAGKTYYYRFACLGRYSPVGRTRTTAASGLKPVTFGVVSCSNYRRGYFHAYRALAEQNDLDCVLHLGDYIYENGGAGEIPGRDSDPPWECLTLEDYRRRYAQHRTDEDLQLLHARHPMIAVWDDHETANDAYRDGAPSHSASDGSWVIRKAAATRAYLEWMPIRETVAGRIFRGFSFGDVLDLHMLDTRLWGRTKQVLATELARSDAPDLLGPDQEAWLFERFAQSKAQWNVLGQQVMMAQLKIQGGLEADGGGSFINFDQWDGYQQSRSRLYDAVSASDSKLVVLTGDIHSSWANELTLDPNNSATFDPTTGQGAVGVEFVTPGVTSPGFDTLPPSILERLLVENPQVRWVNATENGFMVIQFESESIRTEFFHVEDIQATTGVVESAAVFLTQRNDLLIRQQ